jgi:riboflavin transporter FmnP
MPSISRSQRVSLVALFTSLAIVLNFAVAIPAPFAYFLSYEVWEIPVLVAFLILGLWSGVTVAALNTLVLELHPGPLPTGPVYNLIAELSMVIGVITAQRLAKRAGWGTATVWGVATVAGATVRTLTMTVVNALVLPQPYPIGFNLPPEAVPSLLVLIGAFNFTMTLYTVPLAFAVARAVSRRYPTRFAAESMRTPEPFAS